MPRQDSIIQAHRGRQSDKEVLEESLFRITNVGSFHNGNNYSRSYLLTELIAEITNEQVHALTCYCIIRKRFFLDKGA